VSSTPARELLTGGYHNDVWRVRDGKRWLVDKQDLRNDPRSPNPMYPQLPDHEAAALQFLSGSGIAPDFISFSPATAAERAAVRYRFVPGRPWRRGVGDVARALAHVHQLDDPPPLRALLLSGAEARAHGDAMLAETPSALARSLRRLRPHDAPHDHPQRTALVHTDCGPGNVLRTDDGIVIIDWQCPGVGDPVEDVACFLSPAMMVLYGCEPHGPGARQTFKAAYGNPAVIERYAEHGLGWHYRIAAYCVWRVHRLQRSNPTVAERYRRALECELTLLEQRP